MPILQAIKCILVIKNLPLYYFFLLKAHSISLISHYDKTNTVYINTYSDTPGSDLAKVNEGVKEVVSSYL